MSHRWTNHELNTVAQMLRDGRSAAEMGAVFGVSRSSVIGLVRRHDRLSAIGFRNISENHRRACKDSGRRRAKPKKAKQIAVPRIPPKRVGAVLPLPILPVDSRGITGTLMGDPLPGRSALDMRVAR